MKTSETPLVDEAAFSTGNAFIVLHADAQKIERALRAENTKLRNALSRVERTCCIIDAHLISRDALKP